MKKIMPEEVTPEEADTWLEVLSALDAMKKNHPRCVTRKYRIDEMPPPAGVITPEMIRAVVVDGFKHHARASDLVHTFLSESEVADEIPFLEWERDPSILFRFVNRSITNRPIERGIA